MVRVASAWCGLAQNNWTSYMAVRTSRANVPETTWSLVLTWGVTQPHICHPVLPAGGAGCRESASARGLGEWLSAALQTAESTGRKQNLEERGARPSGESQEAAAAERRWGAGNPAGGTRRLGAMVLFPQKTRAGGLRSALIQPHVAKGRLSGHRIAQRSVALSHQTSSPTVTWAWRLLPERHRMN